MSEEPWIVSFPVDSNRRAFTLFVGAQQKRFVELIRPSGAALRADDSDVRLQQFQFMFIATIQDPTPGLWRLQFSGGGGYSLSVRSTAQAAFERDEPTILGADFVELRGRPGHEGYFPIREPVGADQRRLCQIRISGTIKEASFNLVSESGQPLATLSVEAADPLAADEYLAPCVIPPEPFRFQVQGLNRNGFAFQRVLRTAV